MSEPEWTAEHEVSAAQAAELVAAQVPQLAASSVVPLATGWDNTVHLVGGTWVFRFPRRSVALDGFARETALLPRLAPHLPLPIPVPELLGAPSEDFPWPFTGARLVVGTELAASGLAEEGREGAAAGLGEFLRALHDPRLAEDLGAGLPVDPLRRADPAARLARSLPWFERLFDSGLWRPDVAVEALYAEACRLRSPASRPVLVHGDLHVRHLLVDTTGAAAGVIDWGDSCLADPAVDLSLAYGGFSGRARATLLEAYGPVDRDCELRARALSISLCAALADQAAATGGPPGLLDEALRGLARSVA